MSDFDAFDVSPEEYAKASSNALAVPPEGVRTYMKGQDEYQSWTETAMITKLAFKTEKPSDAAIAEGKAQATDAYGRLEVGVRIDLDGVWPDGSPTKNANRKLTDFSRFNITALTQRPDSSHAKMTGMSYRKLKGMLIACGLDPDLGRNVAALVSEYGDSIKGEKVDIVISQGPDAKGEIRPEVDRFMVHSEGGQV